MPDDHPPANLEPPPPDLLPTLRRSPARKATEARILAHLEPASKRQIMERVRVMFAHRPNLDPLLKLEDDAQRRALWRDWCRSLASFPPWAIDRACSEAIAECDFMPSPNHVVLRAARLVDPIRRAVVEARRLDVEEGPIVSRPATPEAKAARRARADEILKRSGFRP